jgi:hypothetical protein
MGDHDTQQQHTSAATSILATKSSCCNLSAQRLSGRTVLVAAICYVKFDAYCLPLTFFCMRVGL